MINRKLRAAVILFLACFCSGWTAGAQPEWSWAYSIRTDGALPFTKSAGLDLDGDGNPRFAAFYREANSVGGFSLPAGAGRNLLLGAFSKLGDFSEAVGLASEGNVRALATHIGPGDTFYVSGVYDAPFNAGGSVVEHISGDDAFLFKFSPEGELLWFATVAGAGAADALLGLVADDAGNVYACGRLGDEGASRALLIKFAADGSEIWRRTPSEPGYSEFASIQSDSDGRIVVGGQENRASRLERYAPDGDLLDARSIPDSEGLRDIILPPDDEVFVAATPVNNSFNAELIKCAPDLTFIDRLSFETPSSVYSLAFDPTEEQVVFAGGFVGELQLGDLEVSNIFFGNDMLVGALSTDLRPVWLISCVGSSEDVWQEVAADGAGNLFLAG